MSESSEQGLGRFGIGGVDQIGYVVEDMDASMPV